MSLPHPVRSDPRYDEDSQYPATPWRRRLRNAGLAVLTAVGVVLLLLYPPGGVVRTAPRPPPPPPLPADTARCAPGQDTACVGGRAAVIVLTPRAPASAQPRP